MLEEGPLQGQVLQQLREPLVQASGSWTGTALTQTSSQHDHLGSQHGQVTTQDGTGLTQFGIGKDTS